MSTIGQQFPSEAPHSHLLTAILRSVDFRQLPLDVRAGLSNMAIGGCQTEGHQRRRGGGDGDGVCGDGGQWRELPHRAGLPRQRPGVQVCAGLQRYCPGGPGVGGGMAGRCAARRLRRPVLARAVVGARSCGQAAQHAAAHRRGRTVRRLRHPPEWWTGDPLPEATVVRRELAGVPKIEVVGRSKDKVEEIFWEAVTQARAELAGVPRK